MTSNLKLNLRNNNDSILIQASEIGFMKNEASIAFRNSNILLITVLPGFTQCNNENVLALLELYGQSPKENLFCTIFNICNSTERQDPNVKGWFVTRDNVSFTPDLLNFDERIPNLIPYLDYKNLLNTSINPSTMVIFESFLHISKNEQINWNVIEGWEWRDEHCLDLLYEKFNNATDFDYAYRYFTNHCYQDIQHLKNLIELLLCSVGNCPEVVLMDIDLTYLTYEFNWFGI
ncbi:unnamed protein product [Rotaria socialis]|uniref:Uncharacterized protein n=1 Tax=Rotaria socialis TaxID=392032 RepID=A0A817TKB0_9BILA|nr:unnamed protein product [Rotaria socialis]CAF3423351.1 unnamed protein product [Rotaria socialis]CAF4553056.1 unnamed protein product [Rotaria socialis]CAF4806884.1 unnamed protein product [Rotaria socialis]